MRGHAVISYGREMFVANPFVQYLLTTRECTPKEIDFVWEYMSKGCGADLVDMFIEDGAIIFQGVNRCHIGIGTKEVVFQVKVGYFGYVRVLVTEDVYVYGQDGNALMQESFCHVADYRSVADARNKGVACVKKYDSCINKDIDTAMRYRFQLLSFDSALQKALRDVDSGMVSFRSGLTLQMHGQNDIGSDVE